MVGKCLSIIGNAYRSRRFLWGFQRANTKFAKKKYRCAIESFQILDAPEKYQSIVFAQIADCHFLLGDLVNARAAYMKAKQVENECGAIRPHDDSEYIILYCDFFLKVIDAREGIREARGSYKRVLQELLTKRASVALKERYLPVPIDAIHFD